MESAQILTEKTTDFIALLSSPIFMSALLCDHPFILKAPLTDHRHHFVVRDSPQRPPRLALRTITPSSPLLGAVKLPGLSLLLHC